MATIQCNPSVITLTMVIQPLNSYFVSRRFLSSGVRLLGFIGNPNIIDPGEIYAR